VTQNKKKKKSAKQVEAFCPEIREGKTKNGPKGDPSTELDDRKGKKT